jgi:hypothetical protein
LRQPVEFTLYEGPGLRGAKVFQRLQRWIAGHRENLRAPGDLIALEEREDGPDADGPPELVGHQHPRAMPPALTAVVLYAPDQVEKLEELEWDPGWWISAALFTGATHPTTTSG